VSSPYAQGEALGKLVLVDQGVTSPGVMRLSGNPAKLGWDIQNAKGKTGSSTVLNGAPVGQISVTFELAGDEDDGSGQTEFDRWDRFARLLETSVNGPKPVALRVFNPDLAAAKMTEICLGPNGIALPTYDGKGGRSYAVDFIQFKPPKPKPAAKPKAGVVTYANTDEGKRTPPDPNAAAKQELSRLTQIAKQP
jgi:hypothetical protein